jgi:ESCRT-I complex subunit VPS28
MDHPAALHRIMVGVPATVEHSSEAGPETGKWIAETTQVGADILIHKPSIDIETIMDRALLHSWMPYGSVCVQRTNCILCYKTW